MLATWVVMQDWLYSVRSRFTSDESGQGMTEYVLILALVAVALFGVINFTGLGSSLTNAVSRVVGTVDAQT